MHGVRRLEAERPPTRSAERLQQLLKHLVRPIGGPYGLGGETMPEIAREIGAQGQGFPVRVPVQRRGSTGRGTGDVGDDIRRGWVRILVGVEPHRHVQLRRAVWRKAAQVVPER